MIKSCFGLLMIMHLMGLLPSTLSSPVKSLHHTMFPYSHSSWILEIFRSECSRRKNDSGGKGENRISMPYPCPDNLHKSLRRLVDVFCFFKLLFSFGCPNFSPNCSLLPHPPLHKLTSSK